MCLYVPNYVHAAINKQINFQGKVTNTNGTNVSNGSYSFTFSIYTVSSGGSPVWSETKSLTVTDGIFRTALGDSVALPGSVNFDTDTLYLGVTFHTDTEMSPRIRLTAVPYAFNSDTLDGLDSTALLRSNTSTSYSSGTLSFSTGTTLDVNAGATLDVNGGLSIADTDITFKGGNTSFDVNGAGTRTLTIYNSTAAQVTDLDLADGSLKTGGTSRLTNGGALQNITGYAQSSGDFGISGNGTFSSGTGAVSLNGDTTIASGKFFRIIGGSGNPTATSGVVWYDTTANKFKIVENGTVKVLCNTTDAGCGTGGTTKWNTIQSPDGVASLSMGTNGTTFAWGQTTTNAFTNTFDSLSSGKGLYLTSAATGMVGNLSEIVLSGNNSSNTGNLLRIASTGTSSAAVPLMVTNLGTGASFRVNDETGDTDTTPFIIDNSGNVGIGQSSATEKLEVAGNVKVQAGSSLITNNLSGTTSSITGINLYDNGMTLASYLNVKYALDNDNSDTGENFQVVTNGSQRTLLTVDESGLLTIGGNAVQPVSGSLKLHSEQGATDYYTLFQTSGAMTQNVTYTLPNDDGNTGQFLTTNGTGTLSWTSAGAWTASGNDIYYTAGKVGVGTSSLTEALNVGGNILIGAQADNTSSVALVNGTAGTYSGQAGIDGAYSSVVFNGKLYVGTKETDNAGVYRYDGGGSWTLVSNAAGKVVSGDAQDIDAITLTVFNGKMYAATRTGVTGTGAVYEYNGSSWTMITPARGTLGAETARDGVYDIHVWNNRLYVVTEEPNASGLYRYDGGTTWTRLNATVGKGLAETTADIDAGVLIAYGGRLWWGVITGSTTGRIYMYDGNTFTLINTTAGQFASGTTGVPDVTAIAVFAGQLFIGTGNTSSSSFNLANVYVYRGGVPGAAGANVFGKLTATSGRVDATNDATDVDYISAMKAYNGRLYVGSSTSAAGNAGGLYEYNGVSGFTTIGTRGTFGAQTNVDQVDSLIEFNGTLYIGTEDSANNTGSIYSFTKTLGNSYGLNFDSGSGNYGELSFVGGTQSQDNAGHMGTFLLSHPLASTTGAFDYAEDYPTFDESVEAGDIVSIDPTVPEYVRKGSGGMEYVGIVSENPGFRLQQTGEKANEARYVPVALVGRVPVKVSTENGQIYPGDYLTGSSVPGVAMKAVKGGAVIGQAMEGYGGEGIGKIIVFVQNTHILGGSVADLLGPSTVGMEKLSGVDEELQVLAALNRSAASQNKTEIVADRIAATHDFIAPTVIANTLIVDTIKANRIEGLEMIAGKLTTLDAAVASVAARFTLSPTDATSSALVNAEEAIGGRMGGLTVTGTATISGDLRVSGNSMIEGILNVIDTITTPRLIVGNWASFMGKVLFREDVEFAGRPTFNTDTAGYVIIKAGSREASVHFDKPYEERPVVSASFVIAPTDVLEQVASDGAVMAQSYQFAVKEVSEKGFTVVLNKPAEETVQLSWIALAVRKQTQGQVLSTESTWRDRVSSLSAELSITPSPLPSPSSFFLTTPIATGEGVIQN